MTAHPVKISRSAAEALDNAVRRTHSPPAPRGAIDELEAAMSAAAEAAAWEPFRHSVLALQARDAELDLPARTDLDQLLASLRDQFASTGISIDDPEVIRVVLMTITATTTYAGHLHHAAMIDHGQYLAVRQAGHPIALAVSRLVDPEAL